MKTGGMKTSGMRQAKDIAAARCNWLDTASAVAGRWNRAAMVLTSADALAAIAFAVGLANGVAELPRGLAHAAPWLLLGATAAVARGVLACASVNCASIASIAVRTALRSRAMLACLRQSPLQRRPVGEVMVSALDAAETMDGYVARFLPARGALRVSPVLILIAIACQSPVSAAILLSTLVPFVIFMMLAGGAAAERARWQFVALQRLGGLFADRVRHMPLLIASHAEEHEASRLGLAADDLRHRVMAVLKVALASSTGLDFFAALSVALVAVYMGFGLLGKLPFGALENLDLAKAFFVLALAPEFYLPMRRLAAAYHDRQAAEVAADALMQLEAEAIAPRPLPPLGTAPAIQFSGVRVRYAGEDRDALAELDFEVRAGETIALMGPSGSGKTTALNLLLGLAPLAAGDVWIGDTALSEIGSIAPWAAWIGQLPFIIPGSITDNLALARGGAPVSRAEMADVTARAGLDLMIEARYAGVGTELNERGSGLSGGERRRLALARALLKDAPILLLDEPTAHLDPVSEDELIAVIKAAAAGRTTIIATHSARLAAIADRVIEMEPV